MSADLHVLLHEAARDEEAAVAREYPWTPDTVERFHRDVRRRRTVGGTALALAVAGAAVVAVLGVARPWQPSPPVVTPEPDPVVTTPAPSPTPDATPAPTPTAMPRAVVGTVTEHPNLPAARPLEAGLLAEAGPGWALLHYSADVDVPSTDPEVAPDLVDGPDVLYLRAPDGTVYQAADLASFGADEMRVHDWAPESSRVLVATYPFDARPRLSVVDLEAGAVVAAIPLADGAHLTAARFGPGGDIVVATTDGTGGDARVERFDAAGASTGRTVALPEDAVEAPRGWLVTPDGASVVVGGEGVFALVGWDGVVVRDLSVPGVLGCRPGRWWPDGRLLAVCTDDLGPGEAGGRRFSDNVWLVDVTGVVPPERVTAFVAPPLTYGGTTDVWDLDGQRYAQLVGDCGALELGRIDGATFEPLAEGVWVVAPERSGFLAARRPGCGDPFAELVAIDPEGTVEVVVPRVGGAYGVQEVLAR